MEQIERIRQMEECLDRSEAVMLRMEEAMDLYEEVQQAYKKLMSYYGSPAWRQDLEDDESGKLPSDLKRGVLSEDGVYNLMLRNRELTARMLRIITDGMEDGTL